MSLSRRLERQKAKREHVSPRGDHQRVLVCIAECEACDELVFAKRVGANTQGLMPCTNCGRSVRITQWLSSHDPNAPKPQTPEEWTAFLADLSQSFNAERKAKRGQA